MSHPCTTRIAISPAPIALWCMLFAILGMNTPMARAQCDGQWIPDLSIPGADSTILAMAAYDPDGPGPMGMHIAMTGGFLVAGNTRASRIALYDPTTREWRALGAGLSGPGYAMVTMLNGDLVVGGGFASAGGTSTSKVARWNGSSWSSLGSGVNGTVYVLHVLPNGDLLAGGTFTQAGNLIVNGLARWNGTEWSGFGAGLGGSSWNVVAIEDLPNGDIIVGGGFTTAGGVAAKAIARWNGLTWSAIGNGFQTGFANRNAFVGAIRHLSNGDLIAGGEFYTSGNTRVNNIALWNGSIWSPMGDGLSQATPQVNHITEMPNGYVLACGNFGYTHTSMENMSVWDGSTWSLYNGGVRGTMHDLVRLPNGDVFVGGQFTEIGAYLTPAGDAAIGAENIAKWNGSSWEALGTGFVGGCGPLLQLPNGDVLAGGTLAGSSPGFHIVRKSGAQWSPFVAATGDPYLPSTVGLMTLGPSGDLYVVCDERILRLTESGWVRIGAGLTGIFGAMAFLANHDIVVGGNLTLPGGTRVPVARWNGATWAPMPGLTTPLTTLRALGHLPNGDLIAGGQFSMQGGDANQGIARWNGTAWVPFASPYPGGTALFTSLKLLPSGNLLATAQLTPPSFGSNEYVLRWNGSAWTIYPGAFSTSIYDVDELPNGDVIAGGTFQPFGGVPLRYLALWNGSSWNAIAGGVELAGGGGVGSFLNLANGDLMVAGGFSTAGGHVTSSVATWRVGESPTITTHPTTQRACHSGAAILSIVAQSDSTLTYHWRHDNQPIDTSLNPSAATASLTIAHASPADAGVYDCIVANGCSGVTSNAARLRVCAADFNCDGAVDFFDFDDFAVCFDGLACPPGTTADFDGDGVVDFFDYDAFVTAFEMPC
ncbi:MAG: immunoglobulin domain-containing protein [Planctomycetota bacterium]